MGITAGIAILIGVVISWGVAVPLLTVNSVPADGQSLSDLATQLWSSQVRFLGAGTIGVAALLDPGDPVQADGTGRLGLPRGSARQ